MKKAKTDPFNEPEVTVEVDTYAETVEKLKKEFGCEVYTIEGIVDGKVEVMYLRDPDYNTQKKVTLMMMKDQTDFITPGEYILSSCKIPNIGYDFYENTRTRLAAAMQAVELIQINDTLTLKKR